MGQDGGEPGIDGAPLLDIVNAGVDAGGAALIRGLSFTLHAGERVGISGPSGCGKTSLLRGVAGLTDLAGGTLRLRGRTPEEWGWPRYRRQVVLVDQRPMLIDAPVARNLAKPFTYRHAGGVPFPEDTARGLLARLGLEDGLWDKPARDLSVGQQQRVCLVRALLLRPAVLLLDEPTSALDPESAGLVEELLAHASRERGLAALVVSHDRAQVGRWCDRAIGLQGPAAGDGP